MPDAPIVSSRLARWGWATVVVNLLVILWGAWVRASHSGAGCGNHWPLCNGEIIPLSPSLETLTEYVHRVTSGFALLLVMALVVGAWRAFPRRHRVRRSALLALVLIIVEALIGAGLVKFELVADNASMTRALTLGAHLVNTQFLLAAIALTAWWAGGRPPIRLDALGARGWWLLVGTLGLLAVGLTGAVASLGDTLFPARTLREGIAQDFEPTSHLLLRLRILHPAIAIGTGMVIAWIGLAGQGWRFNKPISGVAGRGGPAAAAQGGESGQVVAGRGGPAAASRGGDSAHRRDAAVRAGRVVVGLVALQWTIGLVSLVLLVPTALLLAHLLVADLLWLGWIVFMATVLEDKATERPDDRGPSRLTLAA